MTVTEVLSVDKTAVTVEVGSLVKSALAVSIRVGLKIVKVSPKAALSDNVF